MSELQHSFEERAHKYDQWIHALCPYYEEAFTALLRVLPPTAHHILELGCGTGNLSMRLCEKYPKATLTVVDIAAAMIDVTKNKLKSYGNHINYIQKEFSAFSSQYKFDIIVSSLAVHHLDTRGKEHLFEKLLGLLESRGCFYLFDTVQGASRELQQLNHEQWLMHMRAHNLPEHEIEDALARRSGHDHNDPLAVQLHMLKKVGFVDIDVIFKKDSIAVFGGRRY